MYLLHSPQRTVLPYLHVLAEASGDGVEGALLDAAFREELREEIPVATDYVPLCPLDADATFLRHGFRGTGRQVMARRLGHGPATGLNDGCKQGAPAVSDDGLSEVLVASYQHHPERPLYPEVHTIDEARDYIAGLRRGQFGPCHASFLQTVMCDGTLAGVGLGVEARAGLGFVVHLGVLPPFRGQGMGTRLLEALCDAFSAAGLERAALAVTGTNPAAALYTRRGFETIQPFTVYHRGLDVP